MLAASGTRTDAAPSSHPRRAPAYRSVSLRHDQESPDRDLVGTSGKKKPVDIIRRASDEDTKSGESIQQNGETWFDHSNKFPQATFEDDEPPFFLPHNSSGSSNEALHLKATEMMSERHPLSYRPLGNLHAATTGSSADDFRSVIDDLTIENKKLKERLRKFEKSHNTHLEKDKLFEVKIHGLPAQKKRELEDVLRQFASSIDESPEEEIPTPAMRTCGSTLPKHASSSSTSNSRPLDSAYASMSNSGPTSTSTLNASIEKRLGPQQSKAGKDQKIQSFLHNIPEGLLPKHSPVMTERQKKKLVVQRLEQLFTGKGGIINNENSQPLQQQEISNSAARADEAMNDGPSVMEGHREANILPYQIDADRVKVGKLSATSNLETPMLLGVFDSSDEQSPDRNSPGQRPTRPLDLDPDRAQVPSDNVEYIRHLGLSTPRLITEDSADVAADAEGWIYLNLLTNMAQLHIINVTPDFVRSAVADVSEKFQISRDGKKIRWRGGTEGTHFSSDSGASSTRNRSPHSSNSQEVSRKRRKVNSGLFSSVPIRFQDPRTPGNGIVQHDSLHYKPMFYHHGSSSVGITSTDDSDSPMETADSNSKRVSKGANTSEMRPRSKSKGRRHDDGPIVFYSGANFCTDLSGDRGNITTPVHVTGVGLDGYSNRGQDALGSKRKRNAPPIFRTTSGSLMQFRPFKDYSKVSDPVFFGETRPKTPELLNDEDNHDLFIDASPASSETSNYLQDFEASGLGGTQPADHFAVRVKTRRSRGADKLATLSKFSAPSSASKFVHRISKSHLDVFRSAEEITNRLAALTANSSSNSSVSPSKDLPVKSEIVSTTFIRLDPSILPDPVGWDNSSESDSESSSTSSSSGISRLRNDRSMFPRPHQPTYHDTPAPPPQDEESSSDLADESDEVDDDDEESIDMLAQIRELNPEMIREQEMQFEEGMRMDVDEKEAGSLVPVVSEPLTEDKGSEWSSGSE